MGKQAVAARIVIVDRHDNQIDIMGYDALSYKYIYRVSALWLTDSKSGDILLAQRKWTKHNDPGKWACAVAGTVDEGETYAENITKETEEEIGLSHVNFTMGPKQYVDDKVHRFFCQWFFASIDKSKTRFIIQEEEVEAIKWITKTDLIEDMKLSPQKYTPSAMDNLKVLGII